MKIYFYTFNYSKGIVYAEYEYGAITLVADNYRTEHNNSHIKINEITSLEELKTCNNNNNHKEFYPLHNIVTQQVYDHLQIYVNSYEHLYGARPDSIMVSEECYFLLSHSAEDLLTSYKDIPVFVSKQLHGPLSIIVGIKPSRKK